MRLDQLAEVARRIAAATTDVEATVAYDYPVPPEPPRARVRVPGRWDHVGRDGER